MVFEYMSYGDLAELLRKKAPQKASNACSPLSEKRASEAESDTLSQVVKLILQGILLIPPEDCPQFVYKLMAGCWKTEVKDRIKFPLIFDELFENCSTERQQLIVRRKESQSNDEEILDAENYLVPTASHFRNN
ncbi:BDNF/NT-3 growth factors receptor-like protein, partial [Dinothrombium tinctorium]